MEQTITITSGEILIFFAGLTLGYVLCALVMSLMIPKWTREEMRKERLARLNSRF